MLRVLSAAASREAAAASISVGTRIPISATTFALPIEIRGPLDVVGWEFSLTYDAADVQVNDGCDPFSGDIYSSRISRRVEHTALFAEVRAIVVDEVHAFAADDRGWHLLAVLERIARIANRPIQRMACLPPSETQRASSNGSSGSDPGPRELVSVPSAAADAADVVVDYVGNIEKRPPVIARLHQGEKRLVFCDSRARVEDLATSLRKMGVDTYVSHSSLSADERRQAEQAFASGTNCVIVATSTLELGIDVGDLDRVIQIDAPIQVASFLQRLGRTGRRAGTVRNFLFLATEDDSLVRAVGTM